MTRWARGGPANKKKEEEATPWSQMKSSGESERREDEKKKKEAEEDAEFERRQSELKRKISGPPKGIGIAAELEKLRRETQDKEAKQEIGTQIKKEERREKRRLKRIDARESGKQCFHCRENGHDMSSCPKLGQGQGTGICFKCGSTEHSVQKCRVRVPPGEFPYAKCFICGEMGHLSKQCSDNPRGLYPNGGCCRLCGSVEHFKKDCPELQKQQGIREMRIKTDVGIEDHCDILEEEKPTEAPLKKKRKIVKF